MLSSFAWHLWLSPLLLLCNLRLPRPFRQDCMVAMAFTHPWCMRLHSFTSQVFIFSGSKPSTQVGLHGFTHPQYMLQFQDIYLCLLGFHGIFDLLRLQASMAFNPLQNMQFHGICCVFYDCMAITIPYLVCIFIASMPLRIASYQAWLLPQLERLLGLHGNQCDQIGLLTFYSNIWSH